MITIRKLLSLPANTRRRKLVRLLEQWEREPRDFERHYLNSVFRMIAEDELSTTRIRDMCASLIGAEFAEARHIRLVNTLRHEMSAVLGAEPADWDLLPPAGYSGTQSEAGRTGSPAGVARASSAGSSFLDSVVLFLEDLRSPFNVGSIVRTAAAFGLREVVTTPSGPGMESRRARRAAMGGADFVNVTSGELPPTTAGELIVLESGGVPVSQFAFPAQGVLIVGNEELGVSPSLLSKANRRVSIPLAGAKGSLNVGVAVGIALSWWEASLIGGE